MRGERGKRARSTILDVARLARVHPSTVSRILNDRPGLTLRPETRARVLAISKRLDYRPSALARSLRLQRTLTLGMLVPDIANAFLAGIIKGAEEACHERGYTLIVCNTADVPEREATYLRVLRERQVDGVLVASARLSDESIGSLLAERFPVALVNRGTHVDRGTRGNDDLWVHVDDRGGAVAAIDHLAALGHRRIAHVAGPQTTTTGRERLVGTRAALRRHGLTGTIVEAEAWSEVEGYRAARQLLRGDPPSAIFAANDLIAFGVLRAAREAGLDVPEDVALVGFNDIPEAALIDLSTVHVPQHEMGARAAELLIARAEGRPIAEPRILLETRLVARGSSAPAKERVTA